MTTQPILIVEDDPDYAWGLAAILTSAGYAVHTVGTASAAIEAVRNQRFEVVLLDYSLPDHDGIHTLPALTGLDPELPILFLTGHNDAALAVRALRAGAADYLIKPVPRADLLLAIDNARKRAQLRQQLAMYRAAFKSNAPNSDHIALPVGSSATWQRTLELICAAARSPKTTVLLTGEPGVGKEVAASLVHRLSPRSAQPFVATNAACLSSNMVESELFGHEAGSFTGAHSRRRGLFEMANGGTLFVDEIGELSLELQSKLLRVIEGHPFRRLGGEKELTSDVRLIFATNRKLAERVRAGQFRADLYDRLRVFEIELPPLRERQKDIPELVTYFVAKIGAELGHRAPQVSQAALQVLCDHPWPGNVRELRNVVERALVLSAGAEILPRHLPISTAAAVAAAALPTAAGELTDQDVTLESLVKRHITAMYELSGHNVTRSATLLGISRLALRKRLYAYGLRTSES